MLGLRVSEEFSENYEGLHALDCSGLPRDLDRMRILIQDDPALLHKPTMPFYSPPLRDAAAKGHEICVQFLLSRGARPDAEDIRGSNALDAAVASGSFECLSLLLLAGANPNHLPRGDPRHSVTGVLARACNYGRADMVQALLRHGARTEDIPADTPDFLLCTPATTAICAGFPECLKLLLLHGAHTHLKHLIPERPTLVARNSLPHLCLRHAERNGPAVTLSMLRMLHGFGADLRQHDVAGHTALQAFPDSNPELRIALAKMEGEPLTLRQLARLAILKHLGRRYMQTVLCLEIPNTLQDFLLD